MLFCVPYPQSRGQGEGGRKDTEEAVSAHWRAAAAHSGCHPHAGPAVERTLLRPCQETWPARTKEEKNDGREMKRKSEKA